jgi:phage anti-repressor protein
MTLDIFSNKIDDRLSQLLLDNLNTEEQKLFVQSFKAYLEYSDDDTKFVINLDDIWEWVGFSTKGNAKRLIEKTFKKDENYILKNSLILKDKQGHGGQNKEFIIMNVNTFKEFCILANTEKAKEVRKYYVKMENVMHRYTKEKMEAFFKQSQIKEADLIKQLDEAIERNKRSTKLPGDVYIGGNAKEINKDIYKVGEAEKWKKRLPSANTCESDGCFIILRRFHSENRYMAEQLIHTYLTVNKFTYNREFFNINLELLISICELFVTFVNQISSMTIAELNTQLKLCNSTHRPIIVNNNDNSVTTNNDININIQVPQDQIENFKYFSMDTYKQFVEENIIPQIDSHVLSEKLRDAFSKWVSTKDIKPKKYNVRQLYMEKQGFHNEFKDALENVLEIPQTRIYNSGKIRGFDHIKLKDDV